jgi:hypothetical protein
MKPIRQYANRLGDMRRELGNPHFVVEGRVRAVTTERSEGRALSRSGRPFGVGLRFLCARGPVVALVLHRPG